MLAIESNDKRHDRKRFEKQQMLNAEPRDRHVAS
jgi:hypothetical protein